MCVDFAVRARHAAIVASLLAATSVAGAQGVTQAAGPRTLSGIVTDTLGAPLEDVSVYVSELRRQTRTRAGGAFRFDSVPPGRYSVGARKLGYIVAAQRVVVGPDGGVVALRMIHLAEFLPPMVTEADRGGLSGIVGDTAYRALANVYVRVIGSAQSARTDSAGAFFIPVKPGRYFVYLELDGYTRKRVGVTVPETAGRKIAAWLSPQARANPLEGANLFELEQRMNRARPVWTHYFTREDLLKLGFVNGAQAAANFAAKPVDYQACALIDGGPDRAYLWTIPAGDIEFMETNLPKPARRSVTSAYGNPAIGTNQIESALSCPHVVWLRK